MGKYLRTEEVASHVYEDKETGKKTVTERVKVVRANAFGTEDYNIVEKGSFYDPTSVNFNPELNPELDFD